MRYTLIVFFLFTAKVSLGQLYALYLNNYEKALEWNIVEDDKVYYSFKNDTTKIFRSTVVFIEKDYFITRKHKIYIDSLHYIGSYRKPKAANFDGFWIGFHVMAIPVSLMAGEAAFLALIPLGIEALITKRYLNFNNRYGYLNRHSELLIKKR